GRPMPSSTMPRARRGSSTARVGSIQPPQSGCPAGGVTSQANVARCRTGIRDSQAGLAVAYPEAGSTPQPRGAERTPGKRATPPMYPETVTQTASSRTLSVPHIALVVSDSVFLQQSSELILKGLAAAMVFLRGNVLLQRLHMRRANGECAVALLPIEGG